MNMNTKSEEQEKLLFKKIYEGFIHFQNIYKRYLPKAAKSKQVKLKINSSIFVRQCNKYVIKGIQTSSSF